MYSLYIYIYIPFVEGWLCECKVFVISHPKNVIATCSADLPVVHVWCIIVCSLPQAACSLYSCHGLYLKLQILSFSWYGWLTDVFIIILFPIYLSQMFSQSNSHLLVMFLFLFKNWWYCFLIYLPCSCLFYQWCSWAFLCILIFLVLQCEVFI